MNTRRWGGVCLSRVVAASMLVATAAAQPMSMPRAPTTVLAVGPNRPLADINAALARARDGDVVLVDPGTYPGFTIAGKSVSVLAASTPFTLQPDASAPALRIADVPANGSVTVIGVRTTVPFGGAPALEIVDCQGPVQIADLQAVPTSDLVDVRMRGVIEVVRSDSVWLRDVAVWPTTVHRGTTSQAVPALGGMDAGLAAMVAEDSGVHLQIAMLRGYDDGGAGSWGGDALRLLGRCTAVLDGEWSGSQTTLVGGAGAYGGSAVHLIAASPVQDVFGCGTVQAVAGRGTATGGLFAVNHDRGLVQPPPVAIRRTIPLCLGSEAGAVLADSRLRPGTRHGFDVLALSAPRAFVLALGPVRLRSSVLPGVHNPAVLDYGSPLLMTFAAGVLPPSGSVHYETTVPNVPALLGAQLGAQAIFGTAAGGGVPVLSLSQGVLLVVAP